MIRSRRRTAKLSAVTLLGAALLAATTGCGSPMQAGAAVVAGDTRTSDGEIQSQAAELVSFIQANGNPDYVASPSLAKSEVNLLLLESIWQRVAADLGVAATPDQVAQERTAMIADARQSLSSAGGNFTGSDDQAIARSANSQQVPITPSQVTGFVTLNANYTLAGSALAAKAGLSQTDANFNNKINALLKAAATKAVQELKIKVSPRYGTFDAAQQVMVAAPPAWIRTTAPAAAPAAQ